LDRKEEDRSREEGATDRCPFRETSKEPSSLRRIKRRRTGGRGKNVKRRKIQVTKETLVIDDEQHVPREGAGIIQKISSQRHGKKEKEGRVRYEDRAIEAVIGRSAARTEKV